MRFAPSDDALAFRDALASLLENTCAPATLRAAWEGPGAVPGLWTALLDGGFPTVTLPEPLGLDLDPVHAVPLWEESGRRLVPVPWADAVAALPLLPDAPALLDAGLTVSALLEPSGRPGLVPAADVVLVRDGHRLHRLEGATLTPEPGIDPTRRLRRLPAVLPADSTVDVEPAALDAAFDRGAVVVAAQLVGLADAMLRLAVDYVKVREQFGQPVGSFQALQHKLADVAIGLAFARPLVFRAAWALNHPADDLDDGPGPAHVSAARLQAAAVARLAARHALQCHGAIGYCTEHDLHHAMKRAWALCASFGDDRLHRDRIARLVLDA